MYFTSFTLLAIAGVVSAGPIARSSHAQSAGLYSALPSPIKSLNLKGLPSGCSGLVDIIGSCHAGDSRCGCTSEVQAALLKCTECMKADPSVQVPEIVSGFIMTTFEAVCHPEKFIGLGAKSTTTTTGSFGESAPVIGESSSSYGTSGSGSSSSGNVVVESPLNNVAPAPLDQATSSIALFAPISTGSPTPVGDIVDNSTPSSASDPSAAATGALPSDAASSASAPAASSSAAGPVAEGSTSAPAESVAAAPAESAPAAVSSSATASGAANNIAVAAAAVSGSAAPAQTTSGVSGADYQMARQAEPGNAAVALSTRSGALGAIVGVFGVIALLA